MDRSTVYDIVRNYIAASEGTNFQKFCDRLLIKLYPEEYQQVRPGGPKGDMKNDGYCFVSRIFFQAHASRRGSGSIGRVRNKIETDLKGCLQKQQDVKEFIFITNDIHVGEVEKFLDDLRKDHELVRIKTMGPENIVAKITSMPTEDIEYIVSMPLRSEEMDYGIIGEIFDYIFDKLERENPTVKEMEFDPDKLAELKTKIRINFDAAERNRVSQTIFSNWFRKEFAWEFIKQRMETDELSVLALVDKIQNDYCKIADTNDHHNAIKDPNLIESIAKEYIPEKKRAHPDYIANGKAVILLCFELCDIGLRTEKEKMEKQQRPLFPGMS